MPVVRVDYRYKTDKAAQIFAEEMSDDPGVISAEVLDDDAPDPVALPDPMVVSGMLRCAADYAVMLAEALDKMNAQQSVKRDVTP